MKNKKTLFCWITLSLSAFVFADNENYYDEIFNGRDFSNKSFKNSSWRSCSINEVNFSNAILDESSFNEVKAVGSIFDGASLIRSYLNGDFSNASFIGANIQEATITNGFSKEQFYQTKNYILNNEKYNLSGISLSSYYGVDYDLSGMNFEGKILSNSSFTYSSSSANQIGRIILDNSNFKNTDFSSSAFFRVSIIYSNFDGAILKNGEFYNSEISKSSFKDADLTDITFEKSDLRGADFTNAVLSGATFSESKIDGAIIKGADLSTTTQNGFTKELLYSTKSYQTGDLSGVWFDYNNISNWDFSGQNLQNASFFASRLTNADMSKADLRGAEMTAISGAPVYKNTIMSDGIIRNFSMTSAGDSFSIRRYEPDGEGGAMISAKLDTSSTISGGAVLTIESGAEFEVVSGAVLSVGAGSGIAINASLGDTAVFNVEDGAGLAFLDGSFLEVNVLGDFNGAMRFDVIDFADVARISGIENLKKGETFILKLNGETFGGEWDFILGDGALTVVLGAVPEPAACAAVFAVLALGCAALRRRASAA